MYPQNGDGIVDPGEYAQGVAQGKLPGGFPGMYGGGFPGAYGGYPGKGPNVHMV